MKTITFYSYKGGVGRTLALSNIATRLAEFGKTVCIIDFDLEAPGVPYKLKHKLETLEFKTGLVDYLHHYIKFRNAPDNVTDFTIKVQDRITLIPAGNIYSRDYWVKLSAINWDKFFYDKGSTGVAFLYDFKEKIEKEINPDYLLIDSRTGITEIAGITMSLLADEVVLLSVNNEESLEGTQQVLRTVIQNSNPVLGRPPKIHFVMCRVPQKEDNIQRSYSSTIARKAKNRINQFLKLKNINFEIENTLVIHSEPALQVRESLKIAYSEEEATSAIGIDYLRLFEALTKGDLKETEIARFRRQREYEKLKSLIIAAEHDLERISHLEKAFKDYLDLDELFIISELGRTYYLLEDDEKAEKYLNMAIKLSPNDYRSHFFIAKISFLDKKYDKALELYLTLLEKPHSYHQSLLIDLGYMYIELNEQEKGLEIFEKLLSEYPPSAGIYNSYADRLMKIGMYQKALEHIYKALELEPNEPMFNATLAEINAYMGNDLEFYRSINLALSLDVSIVWESIKNEPIYQKYLKEQKFLDLLARYEIYPHEEL